MIVLFCRGKFAQNPDTTKTEYITEYKTLICRLSDERLEVKSLLILNEFLVLLQYKTKVVTPLGNENVVIAAFTTARARLRLYETLERLDRYGWDKVLYFDTDSIVYVKRPGEDNPPTGDYLGELKDEHPSKKIVKFASGGPKNYTYVFEDGSHVTKVKGFTLNYRNAQIITPSLIEDMVRTADGRKVQVTNDRKIARSRKHGIITTKQTKRYRMVYTKRVIWHEGLTIPYGFQWVRNVTSRLDRKRKAHTLFGRGPRPKKARRRRRRKNRKRGSKRAQTA